MAQNPHTYTELLVTLTPFGGNGGAAVVPASGVPTAANLPTVPAVGNSVFTSGPISTRNSKEIVFELSAQNATAAASFIPCDEQGNAIRALGALIHQYEPIGGAAAVITSTGVRATSTRGVPTNISDSWATLAGGLQAGALVTGTSVGGLGTPDQYNFFKVVVAADYSCTTVAANLPYAPPVNLTQGSAPALTTPNNSALDGHIHDPMAPLVTLKVKYVGQES